MLGEGLPWDLLFIFFVAGTYLGIRNYLKQTRTKNIDESFDDL